MIVDNNLAGIDSAGGLDAESKEVVAELVDVLTRNVGRNEKRRRYFEGKVRPKTLGISVPDNVRLETSCSWPEKAVMSLANRSCFDGFVGSDADKLMAIVAHTRLVDKYARALPSELVCGCTFATVTQRDGRAQVNYHSAETASGLWDNDKQRISAGLAIIDGRKSNVDDKYKPSIVNVYMDDVTWVLVRDGSRWSAQAAPHDMGRPMVEPMMYRADVSKPFGRSRITRPVMALTDNYLREMERVEVSAEFYTNPQRWASGLSDEQLQALVEDKWKYVTGSMMGFTDNPSTGDAPTIGQFAQMTMGPHIDYINSLANQFSGVTSIPVSDLGVVQSTYVSAEAVQTAAANLCIEAESLNCSNQAALDHIAAMALAIELDGEYDDMLEMDYTAHFKDPRKPSLVAQADAMLKAIQAVPKLAQSDYSLEQLGISQADIVRINGDAERAAGIAAMVDFEGEL
ncbi:MAG: phage portal protein [Eggerthellaceae bacterium]|nr:phage portal protein [Eggerthellaceae bacterium]